VLDNPLHGSAAALPPGEKDQLVAYLLQLDDRREPRRLEAEDAAFEGGVEARADHPGFSGAGYADYPGAYSGAVRLRWEFTGQPADGRHHLALRYANGSAWPRLLQVRVNGRPLALPAIFAPTGAWDAWETTTVPNVDFPDGPVTLELVARDSAGPNLDYAELVPPDPPACGFGPELPLLLAPFLWRRRRLRRAARRALAPRDWTSPPPT
ncbi:MAG: hypothetical protein K8I02_05895, partial [Candidatus Methylomirabilis sp.]|nr:hypothetical protein [Deltaproteobacteria bacterium]